MIKDILGSNDLVISATEPTTNLSSGDIWLVAGTDRASKLYPHEGKFFVCSDPTGSVLPAGENLNATWINIETGRRMRTDFGGWTEANNSVDTFICDMTGASNGDNEVGLGGGLNATDRTLTQTGTVAGVAASGGRLLDGINDAFTFTKNFLDSMIYNLSTFSIVIKMEDYNPNEGFLFHIGDLLFAGGASGKSLSIGSIPFKADHSATMEWALNDGLVVTQQGGTDGTYPQFTSRRISEKNNVYRGVHYFHIQCLNNVLMMGVCEHRCSAWSDFDEDRKIILGPVGSTQYNTSGTRSIGRGETKSGFYRYSRGYIHQIVVSKLQLLTM